MNPPLIIVCLATLLVASGAAAQSLTVRADRPGAAIAPTMHGIFYEDINFAGDGGLYPERVKNGSFEFTDPLAGWHLLPGSQGTLGALGEGAIHPNNPTHLHVSLLRREKRMLLANEGFRGIAVRAGDVFTFSLFARKQDPSDMTITAELRRPDGSIIGSATVGSLGDDWQKLSADLRATDTEADASLVLTINASASLDLDIVSLLPKQTYKGHGLRADLMEKLADLKPGFVRFPGGCIVEGRDLTNRYRWKQTVGPIETRKLRENRWNVEFANVPKRDYFMSFGLGFFEFFQMSEDLGAAPLPVLNCGMACQFNTCELVPMDQLQPYVQDALDLIEFANGPADTGWGKVRADMGHPEPFGLKYLGIGNEQWGPEYFKRYKVFAGAISAKYPDIELVSSTGPSPDGGDFDAAWAFLRSLPAGQVSLVDEHYYQSPEWFLDNADRYDDYPRVGPKVFAGEFAAHMPAPRPDARPSPWVAALAEAAFMTGLERNADVVRMASYAPLLAHVDATQWTPDLIYFDNLRSYGTPSYEVQKLFGRNRGDAVLPVELKGAPPRVYASASRESDEGEVIVKLVNAADRAVTLDLDVAGLGKVAGGVAEVITASPDATNSFDAPQNVAPRQQVLTGAAAKMTVPLPPYTVMVLRLKPAA